jgi:hypothetical protein
MPPFLADPSPGLLLILGIAALVSFGVWFRWRGKKPLIAAVILLALLGLVVLIGSMYESPREEAVRRVNLMCEAATKANGDQFVEQISTTFNSGGVKRDALRTSPAWGLVKQYSAKVTASGFSRDDFQQVNDSTCIIGFMAKAEATDGFVLRYTKGTFNKDPDGQWRLKDIQFYNAINTKQTEPIPGFP